MLLQDKVAIITGAGGGMGRAIALAFAQEGALVQAADINAEAAFETVKLIPEKNASAVKVDVSDAESVQNIIEMAVSHYGRIDFVVNCAGLAQAFTPIEELQESEWDRLLNVNLKSVFLTAKYAVPYLKKQKQGAIVNIASIAAERARPGLNAYCASKGAVVTLTKALALELAPFGIRVNAINPGPANTDMLGKFIPGSGGETEQQKQEIFLSSIPLGKLIEPDDIAQAALYLCSPLADKVTGTILNVDGGRGI
jgi:3-oxoacyl-[acyl-carrier protein] reductase